MKCNDVFRVAMVLKGKPAAVRTSSNYCNIMYNILFCYIISCKSPYEMTVGNQFIYAADHQKFDILSIISYHR